MRFLWLDHQCVVRKCRIYGGALGSIRLCDRLKDDWFRVGRSRPSYKVLS